jgi:hypothetical protein
MFDTSSFRIRYKAPVEKPFLIAAGPLVVLAVIAAALWSRYASPVEIGPWISSDLLALLLPIAALAALAIVIERLLGADDYPWRRSVAATGAGVVGGTLVVGAWGKLLDPAAFAANLRSEGLTGWLDSFPFVPLVVPPLVVVAIEVLLGTLLVLGVRYRSTLVATGLLIAFFLFLTGRAWYRESHGILTEDAASCGCFGNLLDRSPEEAFWQDAMLLVPGLLLATLAVPQRHTLARRSALAWLVTVGAVGLGWFAPRLPLDDLATRLAPGVNVASICAGRGAERLCLPTILPELTEGGHLVVLLDLAQAGLEDEVERLNAYALSGESPPLEVIAASTPEQSRSFFWKYGPSFEIREAPPGMLRPLYRSLPRSFLVRDGKVTETWSGLSPLVGSKSDSAPGAGKARREGDETGAGEP